MSATQIKRALLSVSAKDGLVDFARGLHSLGIDLISSGGTAHTLASANLPVTTVGDLTGFPEILDGRVKTLHPHIHAAILARRDNPADRRTLDQLSITPIDLVCVNLYPFEQTVARPDCPLDEALDQLDIGGPAMIRAAAKNFPAVYVVTRPAQYATVLRSLHDRGCWLDAALSEELAREAFAATIRYDQGIHRYLSSRTETGWPRRLFLEFRAGQPLRHGENPHQSGAVYWEVPPVCPVVPPSPEADTPAAASVSAPARLSPAALSGSSLMGASFVDGPPTAPRGATKSGKMVLHVTPPVANSLEWGTRRPNTGGLSRAVQLAGKTLSFNNLYDADAAWRIVSALSSPAAVIVKHANPCGAALADTLGEAFAAAYAADPAAAFGGIVALNQPVDDAIAETLTAPGRFLEVIIAPHFTPSAVQRITEGAGWGHNVRLLAIDSSAQFPDAQLAAQTPLLGNDSSIVRPTASPPRHTPLAPTSLDYKGIVGGLLVQSADSHRDIPPAGQPSTWRVVTVRPPTPRESADLHFAWAVVAHVKSNAVLLAKHRAVIGVGAGQMKRLDSSHMAVRIAGPDRAAGAVAASDAFFPFRDGLDELAAAGITAVIQPGGSRRDEEVIRAADQHNIAMVFTARRHFRH